MKKHRDHHNAALYDYELLEIKYEPPAHNRNILEQISHDDEVKEENEGMEGRAPDAPPDDGNYEQLSYIFSSIIKLPQLMTLFIENGFDGVDKLLEVTNEDMMAMNLKVGHKRKILMTLPKLVDFTKDNLQNDGNESDKQIEGLNILITGGNLNDH